MERSKKEKPLVPLEKLKKLRDFLADLSAVVGESVSEMETAKQPGFRMLGWPTACLGCEHLHDQILKMAKPSSRIHQMDVDDLSIDSITDRIQEAADRAAEASGSVPAKPKTKSARVPERRKAKEK